MSEWPAYDFTACTEKGEHVSSRRHPWTDCPTVADPVEFVVYEVTPLLFGPDYHYPETGASADYWTIYGRDADGTALALADTRTRADAVLWLSYSLTDPAPVDLLDGLDGKEERVYVGPPTHPVTTAERTALEWAEPAKYDTPPTMDDAAGVLADRPYAVAAATRAADVVDGRALDVDDTHNDNDPEAELAYAAGVRDLLAFLTTGEATDALRAVLDAAEEDDDTEE